MYGLDDKSAAWIKNYLTDRYQLVECVCVLSLFSDLDVVHTEIYDLVHYAIVSLVIWIFDISTFVINLKLFMRNRVVDMSVYKMILLINISQTLSRTSSSCTSHTSCTSRAFPASSTSSTSAPPLPGLRLPLP
jgi:hypothetical protein